MGHPIYLAAAGSFFLVAVLGLTSCDAVVSCGFSNDQGGGGGKGNASCRGSAGGRRRRRHARIVGQESEKNKGIVTFLAFFSGFSTFFSTFLATALTWDMG